MRYLTIFLLCFAFSAGAHAQNEAIRKFIRKHNNGPENVSVTVPGFLIGLAGEIGLLASGDDEEGKAVFTLVQACGTVRVLTFNTDDFKTKKNITQLLHELESEGEYERWATVRAASGERVELTVRMRGKTVRDLVAIVTEGTDERTHFLHARTDLTGEQLGEVLKELQ